MKYYFITAFVATLAIAGCKSKPKVEAPLPGQDYMITDNVEFVGGFSKVTQLENPEKINLELDLNFLAGLEFTIQDSLLIFMAMDETGYWSLFSLPEHTFLGKYLRKGRGPGELVSPPFVQDAQFYHSNEELLAAIYDVNLGNYNEVNLTKTLADNAVSIRMLQDSVPTIMTSNLRINDSLIFGREYAEFDQRPNRFFFSKGVKSTNKQLDELNKGFVQSNLENSGLIGISVAYDRTHNRIIEVPARLNYINIYSPDGTFAKTISTDEKLYNIGELEFKGKESWRIVRSGLRSYDGVFAVLGRFGAEYEGRAIQFFSIDGAPLMEFVVDVPITSFDIDFRNEKLYVYNYKTEEFFRYDVAGMLGSLNQ